MRTLLAADGNTSRPMSLVLIDIDFFKRINDVHGHTAGDKVLKRFAEISRTVLRDGDVLSRWGGEEFLLMLPETYPDAAMHFVDRLRLVLAQSRFDDIAPQLHVTFSAGVSLCIDSTRLDSAIERADVAMYFAKTQGRDRTVIKAPLRVERTRARPQARLRWAILNSSDTA